MKQLIVNADDLGAGEARNAGIFDAIEAGSVTSVSILPNGPALEDALRRIRALRLKGVSFGVHFNISKAIRLPPRRVVSWAPMDVLEERGARKACSWVERIQNLKRRFAKKSPLKLCSSRMPAYRWIIWMGINMCIFCRQLFVRRPKQ